nr:MAG TPA: hypothetical protein [Bacteriophage sp.]
MKLIPRNEYYQMTRDIGCIPNANEYDILPLDLSAYKLNEVTQRIANANFDCETESKRGDYMLVGHWLSNLCYQFAEKCGFDLVQIDAYSAYAYSDKQMAVFSYTEGDIYLILFTDKAKYEAEKADTIRFYNKHY